MLREKCKENSSLFTGTGCAPCCKVGTFGLYLCQHWTWWVWPCSIFSESQCTVHTGLYKPPHGSALPNTFSLCRALVMLVSPKVRGSAWLLHSNRSEISHRRFHFSILWNGHGASVCLFFYLRPLCGSSLWVLRDPRQWLVLYLLFFDLATVLPCRLCENSLLPRSCGQCLNLSTNSFIFRSCSLLLWVVLVPCSKENDRRGTTIWPQTYPMCWNKVTI